MSKKIVVGASHDAANKVSRVRDSTGDDYDDDDDDAGRGDEMGAPTCLMLMPILLPLLPPPTALHGDIIQYSRP